MSGFCGDGDETPVAAELEELRTALRMLVEQHVILSKQFADISRRLRHYEAHVPAIKQAKFALERGRKNGLIVVREL